MYVCMYIHIYPEDLATRAKEEIGTLNAKRDAQKNGAGTVSRLCALLMWCESYEMRNIPKKRMLLIIPSGINWN